MKLLPVRVTIDPILPEVGVKELRVGTAVKTTKLVELVARPEEVVIVIAPVLAVDGTTARMDVLDTMV